MGIVYKAGEKRQKDARSGRILAGEKGGKFGGDGGVISYESIFISIINNIARLYIP